MKDLDIVKYRLIFISLICILVLLLFNNAGLAGSKPEITAHNANFLGSSINFNVQWQSSYPVNKVKVSLQGVSETVSIDEYDNRRNRDGYAGEVSLELQLPGDVYFDGKAISYVVEAQDELSQSSKQVRGVVRVVSSIDKNRQVGTGPELILKSGEAYGVGRDDRYGGDPPPPGPGITVYQFNVDVLPGDNGVGQFLEIIPQYQEAPGRITWHVLDQDETVVQNFQDPTRSENNRLRSPPLNLGLGSYYLLATWQTPGEQDERAYTTFEVVDGGGGVQPGNYVFEFEIWTLPDEGGAGTSLELVPLSGDVPEQITWHVLNQSGGISAGPQTVQRSADNSFLTAPLTLKAGTYILVVVPQTPAGPGEEISDGFLVEEDWGPVNAGGNSAGNNDKSGKDYDKNRASSSVRESIADKAKANKSNIDRGALVGAVINQTMNKDTRPDSKTLTNAIIQESLGSKSGINKRTITNVIIKQGTSTTTNNTRAPVSQPSTSINTMNVVIQPKASVHTGSKTQSDKPTTFRVLTK